MSEYISNWFTRKEVACKCGCGLDTMDAVTLKIADEVRNFVNQPITPSSGMRCLTYNRKVGSTDRSQHPRGRAMDLPVPNPKEAYNVLCQWYPNQYGFGVYDTFIHIDTRSGQYARWDARTKAGSNSE